MDKEPAVQRCRQKKRVGKGRPFRSQGAKKAVNNAQQHAGQAGIKEALGGKFRSCHLKSLPIQPPAGRGSS